MNGHITSYQSPNFDERSSDSIINILVIHYTGMRSLQASIEKLVDPEARVSSHYLIAENGQIYTLVREEKRAWHAGSSYWRGITDINSHSLGIELDHPGHEFGYKGFERAQIESLITLCKNILTRYPIPARNVVGHSDISPRRKMDPGELFDWQLLAAMGIGLWPKVTNDSRVEKFDATLSAIGYEIDDIQATVRAFQRRYLPTTISGIADKKTLQAISALHKLIVS